MSQMQKRHAEARARTRKTSLDWYHSRRKFENADEKTLSDLIKQKLPKRNKCTSVV